MKRSSAHIVLAVPTRGSIRWETVTRLEDARDLMPGLRPIIYQSGNLSVALTRNVIVRSFLATPFAETLIMVDDDIVPPPNFIETLDSNLAGFGAVAIPHVMVVGSEMLLTAFEETPEGLRSCDLEDGINEVDAVATGCIAITVSALEAIGPNPFRISNDPVNPTSDDFLFCADLKARGYRIGAWWDGWHCDHVTTVGLAPLYERSACVHAPA